MFKNQKISRIIWISGVYIILILILFLVISYKVKWEHLDLNTYLYFYNCDGNLCSSSIKQEKYYNKILCEDKKCPYIKETNGNYLILTSETSDYIYDYVNDKIIDDSYTKYRFSSDKKYIIATDQEGFNYVIDYDDNVLVDAYNKEIIDYKEGYFIYNNDNYYDIVNLEKNIKTDSKYEKIVLISENYFGYYKDDKYYIANYKEEDMPLTYDYIYSFNNYLFVVNNKKIDILDNNMQSKLVMKIDTEYGYTIEKERESLNFNFDGNFLTFNIYANNNLIKYIYDYKNNKLFN